jgi:transketolase
MIARALLERRRSPERFAARSAHGYSTGRYGSQKFHRRECGLDAAAVVEFLTAENDRDG